MERKTKTAIYCRVATKDQAVLNGQIVRVQRFALGQGEDIELVIADLGKPGVNNRHLIDRVVNEVLRNGCKKLFCYAPDRLSRDPALFAYAMQCASDGRKNHGCILLCIFFCSNIFSAESISGPNDEEQGLIQGLVFFLFFQKNTLFQIGCKQASGGFQTSRRLHTGNSARFVSRRNLQGDEYSLTFVRKKARKS